VTTYSPDVEKYLSRIREELARRGFTPDKQAEWIEVCARRIEGMYGRSDVLDLPEAPGVEELCMTLLPNDHRSERHRGDPDYRWDYQGGRVYEHAFAMFHYGLPFEVWRAWRNHIQDSNDPLEIHHACERGACWNWHHLHWVPRSTNRSLAAHATARKKRARRAAL
jgi:hypothetical protein